MRYIPTKQIKEFFKSVKSLPERYRNSSFEENAELSGQIAGLVFAIGAPSYLGWQIGSDISNYFKFGQIPALGTQVVASVAVPICYIKSLGYTTVNGFGNWGYAIGEAITNIRSSLEDLVLRAKKQQNQKHL